MEGETSRKAPFEQLVNCYSEHVHELAANENAHDKEAIRGVEKLSCDIRSRCRTFQMKGMYKNLLKLELNLYTADVPIHHGKGIP